MGAIYFALLGLVVTQIAAIPLNDLDTAKSTLIAVHTHSQPGTNDIWTKAPYVPPAANCTGLMKDGICVPSGTVNCLGTDDVNVCRVSEQTGCRQMEEVVKWNAIYGTQPGKAGDNYCYLWCIKTCPAAQTALLLKRAASNYTILTTHADRCKQVHSVGSDASLPAIESAQECKDAIQAINAANGQSGISPGPCNCTAGEEWLSIRPSGCWAAHYSKDVGYYCSFFNKASDPQETTWGVNNVSIAVFCKTAAAVVPTGAPSHAPGCTDDDAGMKAASGMPDCATVKAFCHDSTNGAKVRKYCPKTCSDC